MQQTVFVVDDDDGLRDATRMFLRAHRYGVETYASAEAFLEAFDPRAGGCVLLDLKMPGMGGLALQGELSRRQARIPVVMVTAHGDVATARAALKAGAFDFIEKPVENEVLLDLVANALRHDAEQRRSAEVRDERRQKLDRLTERERQVMRLVAEGQSHREMAASLGISPRTVEVYKMRLMEKLQAQSVAEVIRIAALEPDRV